MGCEQVVATIKANLGWRPRNSENSGRANGVSSCWCDAWVAVRVEASDGEDRIYDTLATKAAET